MATKIQKIDDVQVIDGKVYGNAERDKLFEIEEVPTKGLIGQFFKALFSLFTRKKTDVMETFGVEKGFLKGLKYLFYFGLLLPVKILAGIVNPKWEYFRVIEKATTPILNFIEGGAAFAVLGAHYERLIDIMRTGAEEALKPDFSSIEQVLYAFRFRRIAALGITAALLFAAFDTIAEVADVLGGYTGFAAFFTTATASGDLFTPSRMGNALDDVLAGVGVGAFVWKAIAIAGMAWFAYILVLIFRLFGEGVRSIFWTRSEDLEMFIIDALDYTHAKASEIYGIKTAALALDMLFENYVLNDERYYNHFAKMDDRRRIAEIKKQAGLENDPYRRQHHEDDPAADTDTGDEWDEWEEEEGADDGK